MSKKYYAVRKGFNTGIFNTWENSQNSQKNSQIV